MHLRLPLSKQASAADLLRALTGLATAGLVMLGVGGTVYHFIAPGGLLARLFSRSAAGGMAVLLAFLLIGVSAWMVRASIPPRERARVSDLLTYAFAVAGLLYVAQLVMKGIA